MILRTIANKQSPYSHSRWNKVFSVLLALEHPYLVALRSGLILTIPLVLTATIASIVNEFPLQEYQSFMQGAFGAGWKGPGTTVILSAMPVAALTIAYSLSASLTTLHNKEFPDRHPIPPSLGVLVTFSCLFIMLGSPANMGANKMPGLLSTLLFTILACSIFLRLYRLKWLHTIFYRERFSIFLPSRFSSLIPALITLLLFLAFHQILGQVGALGLHETLCLTIQSYFAKSQDSFAMSALYTVLLQACYFLGTHGVNLVEPTSHEIFLQGVAANSAAVNSGMLPPHMFTEYLFDTFVHIGGPGGTLGLLLAIFIKSNDKSSRGIASLSIIPGMFNINGIMLFGLPIIFNPIYFVPFIFVPLLLLTTSYIAISTGLVPHPVFHVDAMTPPLVNAMISTGSWRGSALQIINLFMATAAYLPFVELANKLKHHNRQQAFTELLNIAKDKSYGPRGKRCIDREGETGSLARSLANDLHLALEQSSATFEIHYQPRVDLVTRKVASVEVLLRWLHPVYGLIPPVLVLAIADDAGLRVAVDNFVLQQVMEQQQRWQSEKIYTTMSVNISEHQLENTNFPHALTALYERYGLAPSCLQLEVKEDLALDPKGQHTDALRAIHATGTSIAIDGFGKTYQAISQLKRLPISEVQVSQALIRGVANNKLDQDVVGSIQEACLALGIKASAEHVETEEQLETLLELNFTTFQGFLFANSTTPEQCAEFIKEFRGL